MLVFGFWWASFFLSLLCCFFVACFFVGLCFLVYIVVFATHQTLSLLLVFSLSLSLAFCFFLLSFAVFCLLFSLDLLSVFFVPFVVFLSFLLVLSFFFVLFFLLSLVLQKPWKKVFSQDDPGLYASSFLCFFLRVSMFLDSLLLCCLSCAVFLVPSFSFSLLMFFFLFSHILSLIFSLFSSSSFFLFLPSSFFKETKMKFWDNNFGRRTCL